MARELGGDVLPATRREYGPANVTITEADGLFEGIEREQPVWMSHGDSITRLPVGFRATAQTDSTPFAGLADPSRNLYGIQFHPEVVHTPRGRDVLRNFVVGIAGAAPTWPANPSRRRSLTSAPVDFTRGDRIGRAGHCACPAASTRPSRRPSCIERWVTA
jgi:GMP synthase (glutamine-hydrolysing)